MRRTVMTFDIALLQTLVARGRMCLVLLKVTKRQAVLVKTKGRKIEGRTIFLPAYMYNHNSNIRVQYIFSSSFATI